MRRPINFTQPLGSQPSFNNLWAI